MGILNKLAQIQSKVNGLAKNTRAYTFDYVDGNKVLAAIRPWMVELGLLLMPEVLDIKTEKMEYSAWDKVAKKIVTKCEVLCVVKMRMTWVDTESGETYVQEWGATGQNAFDKGFGSALTYGERYYLLKTFHIPTDKDDVDYLATTRDEELQEYYNRQGETQKPQGGAQKPKITTGLYDKFVKAEAEGKLTPSGRTSKDAWISMAKPSEAEIEAFDKAVYDYKANNDLA